MEDARAVAGSWGAWGSSQASGAVSQEDLGGQALPTVRPGAGQAFFLPHHLVLLYSAQPTSSLSL